MRILGPAAMIGLCLAAFALSLQSGMAYGLSKAIGLGAGSVSLAAMSQCLVLAARPRFLEPIFGGLDRMYLFHKWLGIVALGTMLLHELIEPDFERHTPETALGDFGKDIGEIAYYGLIALILFSWIKRIPVIKWEIPYQYWWFTHRLTGAFFALAVLHQLLVDMPFGLGDPLLVFLNILGVVGIACYIFVEFIAAKWRRRPYLVSALAREPGALRLSLLPTGRAMRWRPGQFAFLSAPGVGLGEPHPFTMSGHHQPDKSIQFMIKPLGDWTQRLPERLQPGATVEIEGPYGRFDFRKGSGRQVWIAGGVGITPFLAWVQSLSEDENLTIHLFYSVHTADEAIALDMLKDAAALLPNFSFDLIVTAQAGRLGAKRIVTATPFDPNGADFFFCGPVNLRNDVLKELKSRDITPRRIHFELFEFR